MMPLEESFVQQSNHIVFTISDVQILFLFQLYIADSMIYDEIRDVGKSLHFAEQKSQCILKDKRNYTDCLDYLMKHFL